MKQSTRITIVVVGLALVIAGILGILWFLAVVDGVTDWVFRQHMCDFDCGPDQTDFSNVVYVGIASAVFVVLLAALGIWWIIRGRTIDRENRESAAFVDETWYD